MMGNGDQALVERIENLEEEIEEQRLLLRYTLDRFDREAEEPAKKGAYEKRTVTQTPKTDNVGTSKRAPEIAPWPTMAQRLERSSTGQKNSGELAATKDEQDERGSFDALAELFRLRGWEWWLNKIGIGLLLFGVVFLFKFSVDQGWLIPEVRVGLGLALGAGLVWLGLRVYEERRAFSQVMLGGGIGTFYITGFAAFQLYALVPYALAFTFLVAVTLLAFTISIRQDEAALSLIGAAGGFGTPFLLYDGSGGLGGLVLYTTLILTGIAAVYLYKGWRSLLLFSAAGVWMVLLAGYDQAAAGALENGRPFLQAGALFAVLVLWLGPVAREVLRRHRPQRWPVPEPGSAVWSFLAGAEKSLHPALPAHLLSGLVPLVGLAFTQEIWDLYKQPLGGIVLCVAAVYAMAAVVLRRVEGEGRLSYTNALMALLLFTLGIVLFLQGNALFFSLAAEAALLHVVSRRLSDKVVLAIAHGLFLTVGIWLSWRILSGAGEVLSFGTQDAAFLNGGALLDLFATALAFGVSTIFDQRISRVYRIAAHIALLGLLFRELIGLPGGDTVVFLSWAAYASALLLLSRHYSRWGTVAGSHVIWVVVGFWLAGRLAWGFLDLGWMKTFNLPVATDLVVICLALLTSTLLSSGRGAIAYRVVVHVAVLAWLWRELGEFPDGAAYVTVAWGVYAAGLLVFGLRRASTGLMRAGVITLFLVVGKLFLVDLVWVGAIWRILLFLGFGGLFLVLSYYLQALWREEVRDRGEGDGSASLGEGE